MFFLEIYTAVSMLSRADIVCIKLCKNRSHISSTKLHFPQTFKNFPWKHRFLHFHNFLLTKWFHTFEQSYCKSKQSNIKTHFNLSKFYLQLNLTWYTSVFKACIILNPILSSSICHKTTLFQTPSITSVTDLNMFPKGTLSDIYFTGKPAHLEFQLPNMVLI